MMIILTIKIALRAASLFEAIILPRRPHPIHQWKHRDLRVHINLLFVVYGPLLSTAAAVSTTSFPSLSRLGAFLARVSPQTADFVD